jgi:hypothetical protein
MGGGGDLDWVGVGLEGGCRRDYKGGVGLYSRWSSDRAEFISRFRITAEAMASY